jgi:hypothetical protein
LQFAKILIFARALRAVRPVTENACRARVAIGAAASDPGCVKYLLCPVATIRPYDFASQSRNIVGQIGNNLMRHPQWGRRCLSGHRVQLLQFVFFFI